jgi:predicted ATPase/class 3 adenylate cyclase
MTLPCTGCGGGVPPGASFCPQCGRRQPAAGAQREADRRQVTVVFADLSGFTSMAERLDPETVRAFQNALFDTLADAVARYDGFVEKFVGDAVLAVFGAPHAHEDDPLRALEAAQEMMRRVDSLSARWTPRLGGPVALHVGVHTGPVVAGSLGRGAEGAYAVTGDTVNTAARLLSAAEPGSVLVSATTRALVHHRFRFAPAAELALRGKAQPVPVHRLLGVRDDAAPARGLAELGLVAPLVGRDDALGRLVSAFERMRHGQAQVVRLVGEAGSGKSRLLDEFLARLHRDGRLAGVAVRRTACMSLGEAPYGTFAALFRDAYSVDAGDSLQEAQGKLRHGMASLGAGVDEADAVARVLQYLLGIREERPRDIEPEQLQRHIVAAAHALLERRLARQPVLAIVDDLQWADAASVDLLHEIVDQLADRALMLLVLHRPDARPLSTRHAEETVVELGGLSEADTRALVGHLLGAPSGDATLPVREYVAARAEGNPLFVEEILRSLVERGLLAREQGRWTCKAACEAVEVPPTLYGLLLSRIDRLPADERRALQEAAVLGAEFDGTLLERIAGTPQAMPAALQRLAAAELLRAHGPRWRFAHALLHEVVYENLLLARRAELHRLAGEALEAAIAPAGGAESRGPQRLAELEALGHHWSLSPDKLRGAHYLLAAGDWARGIYANDDAIRHYERALRTLAQAGPDAAQGDIEAVGIDARERLADLLGLQGRRIEALAHYEAVRLAVEASDAARAARVLRKTGGLHWEAGDRERASACFDAGLAHLSGGGDAVERAHLLQEMGRLAFRAGDNAAALELARRALDELPAAEADSPRGEQAREVAAVRAQARNTLGVALARLGRPQEAVAQIECSVAEAEAAELLQAACRGYTNLGVLYASLDPDRSIATCVRGLETARKVGDLAFQSRLYANLAVAYCALTNRCEAEGIEAARAAVALDRRLGLLDHLAVPLIVLGQIHQCRGERGRAFEAYEEALRLALRVNEPQLLFPCYDGLATLCLDAGRRDEAEAYLATAQALCERSGLEPDSLMVLPFLC